MRGEAPIQACWHADCQVMRYNPDHKSYEKVPIKFLKVGDEVLVQNPHTKTVGREKITRMHDHSKEKRKNNCHSVVKAT